MTDIPADDGPAPTEDDGAGIDGDAFSPVIDPDYVPEQAPQDGEAATGGEPVVPGEDMRDGGRGGSRHIPRDPRDDEGTVAASRPGN